MTETALMHDIMRVLGRGACRVFRNNCGIGWAGQATVCRGDPMRVVLRPGDVVVRRARPLHAGLCSGSSDLIGIRTIEITPDMVGRRLGVFVAIEVKTAAGALTREQETFLQVVRERGGIGVEARTVVGAEAMVLGAAGELGAATVS